MANFRYGVIFLYLSLVRSLKTPCVHTFTTRLSGDLNLSIDFYTSSPLKRLNRKYTHTQSHTIDVCLINFAKASIMRKKSFHFGGTLGNVKEESNLLLTRASEK